MKNNVITLKKLSTLVSQLYYFKLQIFQDVFMYNSLLQIDSLCIHYF